MFTVFPTKRRLKFYLYLVLVITALKIPWVIFYMEDGHQVLNGDTKSDLLARRRYLIDRVYDPAFGVGKMPSYLGSQFKGEWAVGTFSMLAAAVTNISYIHPETRNESLKVVEQLIQRSLTEEFREFDTARWGEDALTTLNGGNGHIGYLV